MFNSITVRKFGHGFHWLKRLVIVAAAVTAVLMALVIVVLRYWILPDIGQYREQISNSLAAAIGNPVSIGKIEGDWQGLRPRLDFTDVRILDEHQKAALVLPGISGSVSWMSLLTLDLRLASLEIDRPELLIHRDTRGDFFIGGVALSKQGSDHSLSDWLLHQNHMVVRDALIVWIDELRDAPPLVLKQVNFRAESLFRHHRFALQALPPNDLSTPLDVRGDFTGTSFVDFSDWRGQIFTQLDHTDVTAWRPWLDMPAEFSRGRGALRGWLGIDGGNVTGITADMDLHDVATKLAADLPEMAVNHLHGRVAWKDVAGGVEFLTRHLAMRFQNGIELKPTDFYCRVIKAIDGQPARGEIKANQLDLGSIVNLANFVPMATGLRSSIDQYSPQGKVSGLDVKWQGALEKPDSLRFKGDFADISANQVGRMPGLKGLTGTVDGNEDSGKLKLNSHQVTVNAEGAIREPLRFATLTAQAGWKHKNGELYIHVDNLTVANEDLAGTFHGDYQTLAGTRGLLDLNGKLTRGDVRRAARYTPLIALQKEGNDWLNDALLSGHTDDFHIQIKGNLSDFPLDGTKRTIFKIGGHAQNVVLMFDSKWPRIENISGEFSINGNVLQVVSPVASMAGARLQNVTVTLPDIMSKDLALEIKGEAVAPSNIFLKFIQNSPVRGYTDGFTDNLQATGNAHLDLNINVPLGDQSSSTLEVSPKTVRVAGTIRVQDNDIDLGSGAPLLRKTNGALSFTDSGMQANGVTSEILGGPASINVKTAQGGEIHATVRGRSNLDVLHTREASPWLNYFQGGAAWDADIKVVKKAAQVIINSNLQGISSVLPQPFTKSAGEAMTLRIEKKNVVAGQDTISIQLGKLMSMRLARRDEQGAMIVKRGMINFGESGKGIDKEGLLTELRTGVWLAGSLPIVSIQGWDALLNAAGETRASLPIAGANLYIEKLTGYGQNIKGLNIEASKRGDGFSAQLSSNQLTGSVIWQPHGYENGAKLSLNLPVVKWLQDEPSVQSGIPDVGTAAVATHKEPLNMPLEPSSIQPGHLPALEIAIENLQFNGKQVGHLSLVGYPDGRDWRLRRLNITNPDGTLVGDGIWLAGPGKSQTRIDLQLDISDAGKILDRSGYPNTVKEGSGKLAASLTWSGGPDRFNYTTLNGTLKLDADKGRFLKMEPGIGKLLSVLSLQALPKRITLDFNDVFSDGFQFDNINGNATINAGVIDSQDFHIDGSSAKVTMKGSVNLNNETQDLRVRVLPTVGDSVSLIGAFAAGPVVGVGTFILNKVLGNPLDKLVSFEYNVSGTWVDPKVLKVGRTSAGSNENSK